MFVPKHIILTAPDKDSLHPKIIKNIEGLKMKNPEWNILIYDDQEIYKFIKENFSEFYLETFNSINPKLGPARADLFRYLYIFKNGGVYLDIKSSFKGSFVDLIDSNDKFIVSSWGKTHQGWGIYRELGKIKEFQQWFIISAPQNPILKFIIDKCLLNLCFYNPGVFGIGKTGVVRTTGPVAYTQEMIRSAIRGWRRINSEEEGLVYSIFGDGFSEHGVAFDDHYLDLSESVVDPIKSVNREKYKSEIQQLVNHNERKIFNSESKTKKFDLNSFSELDLKKELEMNPTDFFVLFNLSEKLISQNNYKDAIDVLKLQLILRPYCKQSYETIFRVQEAIS